jgi:hypothetical protein
VTHKSKSFFFFNNFCFRSHNEGLELDYKKSLSFINVKLLLYLAVFMEAEENVIQHDDGGRLTRLSLFRSSLRSMAKASGPDGVNYEGAEKFTPERKD